MQVVLDESAEILRADRGRLICRTHHGFVCANAGVDASNAGARTRSSCCPRTRTRSARALRARLGCAVVVTDSFGRAWRHGQCEVAIGCAGLAPLEDWRGRAGRRRPRARRRPGSRSPTRSPRAADLVRGKDTREPAVRIRGLERHVTADDGPGAAALVRALQDDLFR